VASHRFSGRILDKPLAISDVLPTLPSPIQGSIPIKGGNLSALYVVDGQRINRTMFVATYGSLQANMFESVEILRQSDAFAIYGMAGFYGAYVFKTKKFTGIELPDASIQLYTPEGYCIRKEFYMPEYNNQEARQNPLPDLRTTIYWNPVIRTDEAGKAAVRFFTADNVTSYSYILEGIGDKKTGFQMNNR
jgi:hypothetical protein